MIFNRKTPSRSHILLKVLIGFGIIDIIRAWGDCHFCLICRCFGEIRYLVWWWYLCLTRYYCLSLLKEYFGSEVLKDARMSPLKSYSFFLIKITILLIVCRLACFFAIKQLCSITQCFEWVSGGWFEVLTSYILTSMPFIFFYTYFYVKTWKRSHQHGEKENNF